jgi:hypothetical protein
VVLGTVSANTGAPSAFGHGHEFVEGVGLGHFIPNNDERMLCSRQEFSGALHRLKIPTNDAVQ